MDQKNRLTSQGMTIKELLQLSLKDYYKKEDDKKWRAKLDIVSGKIVKRKNYKLNVETKQWEQTGRDVKIEFIIKSDPISYKKTDHLAFHYYPVTFLIHSIELGFESPFKFRTGSLKKPKFSKKGSTKEERERVNLYNLRNGIQLDFFFHNEWVLRKFNLLYGVNWAAWPPNKTNPRMIPYFDKHSFFIVKNIFPHLFKNKGVMDRVTKNDEREKQPGA